VTEQHPVERLFETLSQFGDYPAGVVPISSRIPGTAFFPGGSGLWATHAGQPLPPMPIGGVMVLGHNFDSETGFADSLARGIERMNGPTWGTLRKLFARASVPMERCFYTNAFMGLKAGTKATGTFPGARDPDFVRCCQTFLLEQIRTQQPQLILTLGAQAPRVIAPLASELASHWSDVSSLLDVDNRSAALVSPVHFAGLSRPVTVAALTHPSQRPLNVGRRIYGDNTGDAAELELLRDALAHVDSSFLGDATAET
jgi:uracil-DNA glycosylase